MKSAFKQEFAAKAANKQEFDAFMQQVYGDKYDKGMAEQFRQQALAGDFSFLPDVKFVDAATLQGDNGAYNAEEGVVYINKDLAASDPAKAAQTFVEEAGHHLDAKLNTADTQGDEGEMFRRVLGGEQLSQQQINEIRNDDDHGTITVDGKQVEVEFCWEIRRGGRRRRQGHRKVPSTWPRQWAVRPAMWWIRSAAWPATRPVTWALPPATSSIHWATPSRNQAWA